MLQKSSARKVFCAEDWRIWRVKWYIQHAGCVVFTDYPAWVYFFEKKFSCAEDCAESCAEECAKSQLFFNVCCSAKPFVVRRYFSKIQ